MCVAASLDVHGKARRVAAQPLRAHAQRVHGVRQLRFEARAFRVGAGGAERSRRGDLGQVHAQVRGAADADADDRRRARLAAGVEHAVDDEALDRVDAVGGNRHLEPRVVLGARAFRDHLDLQAVERVGEREPDDRHAFAARRLLVAPRQRVHDRRAQRMLARRALAAAADRRRDRDAVDRHAPADRHVVDRNPRVLAQQVVGRLGHRDVLHHHAEHPLRGRVGLARGHARERRLDVGRQHLERANVEFLRDVLDDGRVDGQVHWTTFVLRTPVFALGTALRGSWRAPSRDVEREQQRGREREGRRGGDRGLLRVGAPADELDEQQPQSAPQVDSASASTSSVSATFTSGCRVHVRNASKAARPAAPTPAPRSAAAGTAPARAPRRDARRTPSHAGWARARKSPRSSPAGAHGATVTA